MAQTSAERQKAYRARKRAQQLQARAERACVVCGAELPTTARAEARTCSSRCRQRLHAHPTLLESEHGRNWVAAQERRRLGEEALTPQQRQQAKAWDQEQLRRHAKAAETATEEATPTEEETRAWVERLGIGEEPGQGYNQNAALRALMNS